MSWLGTLAELDLDHLDLGLQRVGGKGFGVEAALAVSATEVARADFPDQVAAVHTVPFGDRAFTRVVRKAAALCACVEGLNGVGRERAKTHGRDVEHTGLIGLTAFVTADAHPEIVRGDIGRHHGVVDPLVAVGLHIALCAEGAFVGLPFGTRIGQ